MLRVTTVICALSALVVPAAVFGAQGAPADLPVARVVACDESGEERAAVFSGRMQALPATARMGMRFTLLERLGRDAEWERLDVPELRAWRRSALGVKTFAYRQRVEDLRPGAAYRALVQFRWYGAGGTVLRTVTRPTRACRGELPNLQVGGLDVRPGPAADTRVYRVTVLNTGEAAAEGATLQLQVDRAVLDAAAVPTLEPGESRVISFTGPACERSLRAKVDAGHAVGETNELDNARTWPCPA